MKHGSITRYCLKTGLLLAGCLFFLAAPAQQDDDETRYRKKLASGELNAWQQAMTMSNLAHMVYYRRSHEEGIRIVKEALDLVQSPAYRPYRAYLCSMLGTMYSDDHDRKKARQYIDSAIHYSRSIKEKAIKGRIWYTDGWLKFRENKPQEAIASHLKGISELQQEESTNSYIYQCAIYGEIARIYEQWKDLDNQVKYSRLNLQAAAKTTVINLSTSANYNMGNCFMSLFQKDTMQRRYLDSALLYNKRCISIIRDNRKNVVHLGELAVAAYNIADIYLNYMPSGFADSANRYLDIAVEEGKNAADHPTLSKTYILRANNEVKKGNLQQAEVLLGMATSELVHAPIIDINTNIKLLHTLGLLNEKKGNPVEALRYYKEYIKTYTNIFDKDKMALGKQLEAQYESARKEKALLQAQYEAGLQEKALFQARYEAGEKGKALLTAQYDASLKDKALLAAKYEAGVKEQALNTARYKSVQKEQELKSMEEKVSYNYKLNKIYAILTIACFLAFAFLFYAYKQRSKTLAQSKKLHELEVGKIKQEHRISMLSAILEGQEQERTRLARDLHDGLGGLLSGTKIELSSLLPLAAGTQQQQIIHKTFHHLDNSMDELRRIARSMMPEVLLVYGLGEATREYCNGLHQSGVPVTCQVYNYKNDMSHSRQVTLYRIMQELVNNAIKHAGASQILVQLQQTDDRIFLTVEDDGRGFDTAQVAELKGAGLANIRSRVEHLQGRLDIHSEKGTGTTFTVECSII